MKLVIKILNLKLKILLEYQNIKTFLQKAMFEIVLKKLQKPNQKQFRVEKVITKKGDKLHAKWKGYDSSFNIWIDKRRQSINE